MDASTKARLKELSDCGSAWKSSPVRGSDPTEQVRWVPILNLEQSGDALGITDSGFWVREGKNGLTRLDVERNLVFLLPCLEIPYDQLLRNLESGLKNADLPGECLVSFPFRSLLLVALASESEHWVHLATKWCGVFRLDERIIEALRKVTDTPTISQRVRHNAWALIHKLGTSDEAILGA